MVRLNQIQEKMSEMHELDSGRFFVDISGETLDEALANAAIQLGMPVSSIDYEILQKERNRKISKKKRLRPKI